MKSTLQLLVLLASTILLTSCSPRIASHSQKEKGVDLKPYRTYAWSKPGDEEYQVTYDKKEAIGFIIDLSNEELKKKGFMMKAENPDAVFIVDTHVEDRIAHTRTDHRNAGFGFGVPVYHEGYYGGYYGGYVAPIQSNQNIDKEFLQGMVYVEMYDAKTKKMLWRGWAESQITNNTNMDKLIRNAVKKAFGHLPVKHK